MEQLLNLKKKKKKGGGGGAFKITIKGMLFISGTK